MKRAARFFCLALLAAVPAIGEDRGALVRHYPAADVTAAFAQGAVLFDGSGGANYMIHASRREKPGMAEVHVKDANRPTVKGNWGEEVPLGQGQANIKKFVQTLKNVGYRGPLCIEREVGDQPARIRDIAHGIKYLKECLAA